MFCRIKLASHKVRLGRLFKAQKSKPAAHFDLLMTFNDFPAIKQKNTELNIHRTSPSFHLCHQSNVVRFDFLAVRRIWGFFSRIIYRLIHKLYKRTGQKTSLGIFLLLLNTNNQMWFLWYKTRQTKSQKHSKSWNCLIREKKQQLINIIIEEWSKNSNKLQTLRRNNSVKV